MLGPRKIMYKFRLDQKSLFNFPENTEFSNTKQSFPLMSPFLSLQYKDAG